MTSRWRFNPKRFLIVCEVLASQADENHAEAFFRARINRYYLIALQVAAYHLESRGKSLPDDHRYYGAVRELLVDIGCSSVSDHLTDLQDYRSKADYRYGSRIDNHVTDVAEFLMKTIVAELDQKFPQSRQTDVEN